MHPDSSRDFYALNILYKDHIGLDISVKIQNITQMFFNTIGNASYDKMYRPTIM